MAKKKAQKKSSRKVPKEPEMQTLPRISVLMANDILKVRKKEIAGSANEIDWDPSLEDLWRALVSVYWIYGEQELLEIGPTTLDDLSGVADARRHERR